MEPFELMHRAIDRLREAPGVRALRRRLFDHRFARYQNAQLFRGVFRDADGAIASAPGNRPIGCDNAESANLEVRLDRNVKWFDYFAFFWIADAIAHGARTLADLGGSVGMKFYAYERLKPLPPDFRWTVIEVTAMVERGRAFAREHGEPAALAFTDDRAAADGVDVLLASGSLQYIEQSLAEIVARYATKPKRLVVNQTPIHPTRSFFTLNSIGTAYCAYRVDSRDDFVRAVEAQGYRLRDEWKQPGKKLELPFEDGYSLDYYMGFCFDRA